jgi:steroid 5-alpha reductase family enzyme
VPQEFLVPGALCAGSMLVCYGLSLLTGNYSQVDRLWSILPPIYVGIFAAQAGFPPRLMLMTALTAAWGARLTFNFARKGGYRWASEDYRWPVLRKKLGATRFQLLNATFIAPYQNILLLLISLPAAVAGQSPGAPLGWLDGVAALGFTASLALETIADQQQWAFQVAKAAALARGDAAHPPFLDSGLFRYSRHPNYFFEQAQWWCLYLLGVAACGRLWNIGLLGPTLLVLLFLGSTRFAEEISLSKYPSYADYQRRTSRQWPWPARRER